MTDKPNQSLLSNSALNKSTDAINKHDIEKGHEKDDVNQKLLNNNYETFDGKSAAHHHLYLEILNTRNSKYHIIPAIIYVISLVALEFLILQVVVMMRPFMVLKRIEIITFVCLIFFGIAGGAVIKNLLLEDKGLKMKILITVFVIIFLHFFMIITHAEFILFLCYPPICVGTGFILFTIRQIYEDFYMECKKVDDTPQRTYKNLFISLPALSSLLVILYFYFINPDLYGAMRWDLGLLLFGFFLVAIAVLSIFMKDSPLSTYRNTNDENYTDIYQVLEYIKQSPLNEQERKKIIEDIKHIVEKTDKSSYADLFTGDNKYQSTYYYINTACCSYGVTSMLISLPYRMRQTIEVGPDYAYNFYLSISIVFIIAGLGRLFGTVILKLFSNFKRKYIIIGLFACNCILSFGLILWFKHSYIIGGVFLFFSYAMFIILMNYAHEIYSDDLKDKAYRTFEAVFYLAGAFTVIIFESFAVWTYVAGYVTVFLVSLTGLVFAVIVSH